MNKRTMAVVAMTAMATLVAGTQVFAGTQTRTRDRIKDGTCIKKKYDLQELDGTQTRDRIKDGTCIKK